MVNIFILFTSFFIFVNPKKVRQHWIEQDYSYLAEIYVQEHFMGGGVLYKRDIVLTSALYVERHIDDIFVRINSNRSEGYKYRNLSYPYAVAGVLVHPNFRRQENSSYNIAIVQLQIRAKLTSRIQLLYEDINENMKFKLLGWGFNEGDWVEEQSLFMELELPGLTSKQCNDYNTRHKVASDHTEICAGFEKSTLNADAASIAIGSPLIIKSENNKTRDQLVGLLSWSSSRDYLRDYAPCVFIYIPKLAPWIEESLLGIS